jgi:hypothetical protein
MHLMIAVAFSALVIVALISIAFYWTPRIHLIRMDSARDRIEWLSFRSGDAVLNTYEALFPRSILPRFCRLSFWTLIVCVAAGLSTMAVLKTIGR